MNFPVDLARRRAEQKRLIEPELAQLLSDALDEIERLTQESLEQVDIAIHAQRAHYTREYRS